MYIIYIVYIYIYIYADLNNNVHNYIIMLGTEWLTPDKEINVLLIYLHFWVSGKFADSCFQHAIKNNNNINNNCLESL